MAILCFLSTQIPCNNAIIRWQPTMLQSSMCNFQSSVVLWVWCYELNASSMLVPSSLSDASSPIARRLPRHLILTMSSHSCATLASLKQLEFGEKALLFGCVSRSSLKGQLERRLWGTRPCIEYAGIIQYHSSFWFRLLQLIVCCAV